MRIALNTQSIKFNETRLNPFQDATFLAIQDVSFTTREKKNAPGTRFPKTNTHSPKETAMTFKRDRSAFGGAGRGGSKASALETQAMANS